MNAIRIYMNGNKRREKERREKMGMCLVYYIQPVGIRMLKGLPNIASLAKNISLCTVLLTLPFPSRSLFKTDKMEATNEYYDSVDLHIRWSDRQDLILRVSPEETIYTIKEKVFLPSFV